MGSVNKVLLIGNLGADPELWHTAEGRAKVEFSIATKDTWKDRESGERKERSEWHRIVVWGPQAETCSEHLSKGRSVCVEGSLRTRSWKDAQGTERSKVEILADQVTFLSGPRPVADYRVKDSDIPDAEALV